MELRSYIKRASYFIWVIFSLALVGCGGGGGGGGSDSSSSNPPSTSNTAPTSPTTFNGSTSRATVTSDNSEEISDGAYQAARKASSYASAAPIGFRSSGEQSPVTNNVIQDAHKAISESLLQRYSTSALARIDETIACDTSGNLRVIFPDLDAGSTVFPSSGTGSVIYNNCSQFELLIDGTIDFSWSGIDSSTGVFSSFTTTFDLTVTDLSTGLVQSVSGSATCTNNGLNCTYSEDFAASNGTDYRVEDVVVTGNASSGYDMTARVYHEVYGYVDVVATGLTYCTDGTGNLATGNISVTDSNGLIVLEVEITSCNDCVVIFGGVSTIVPQPQ